MSRGNQRELRPCSLGTVPGTTSFWPLPSRA
jgi:hypothetical protein